VCGQNEGGKGWTIEFTREGEMVAAVVLNPTRLAVHRWSSMDGKSSGGWR
jgi:hypothetical protein